MGTLRLVPTGEHVISTQPDNNEQIDINDEANYPTRSGWAWVPSLYFAQGIPYVIVTMVSAAMYKRFGVSNANIGWYTSLLGLPWVIKPLWGPLVDLYWSKRKWTLSTQALMAIGLIITAFLLPTNMWWTGSLIVFALMAFASATHDIAADGFYMLGLDPHRQALFNGIRSTFWRLSMIIGTGVLVILAGVLESHSGPTPVTFSINAGPAGRDVTAVAPAPGADEFVIIEPRLMNIDAGTTQLLTLKLASAPEAGTTVALSVSPKHSKWYEFFVPVGEANNIKIHDADRVELNSETWNTGKGVVVQVDKNLKTAVLGNFNVASGKIPWAWGICIGVVAGVFTLLWLWHMFILPKPQLDNRDSTGRPPFIQAAFWLLVAVGVPLAVLWGAYSLVKPMFVDLLLDKTALAPTRLKNLSDLIGFGVWGIIGLVAWMLISKAGLGKPAAAGFRKAAQRSGLPFDEVFASFFRKPGIGRAIIFLLTYRLADALLVKMIPPFMLDSHEVGGLGLSTTQYGLAYGTIGVLGLLLGGIAGSVYAATQGLLKVRLVMCMFMNLPILLFVLLAYFQPSFLTIMGSVFVEQFGYGFGFSMYMLYMLFIAGQGVNKASHYALCTGFMALSFMLPGMLSGILQEFLGYEYYFILVTALASLSFVAIYIIPIDPEFGLKKKKA